MKDQLTISQRVFNPQEYVAETRAEIARIRSNARLSKYARLVVLVIGLALFVCAFIQLLLNVLWAYRMQSRFQYRIGMTAGDIWRWFETNFTTLWNFVASLPFPKALPQANYYLPWIFSIVFYLCFVLSAAALKNRAVRLKAAADQAEQILNLQAPLLKQMSVFAAAYGTAQSANVGSLSGTGNTVNVTNTINHALEKAGEKKITDKFWIPLAIAAITALLNYFLK